MSLWWRLDLFAPLADSEGRPLWQPCTDTPKGVTNAERGKRYQCDAPYAPVYAKASENKGPPVKTLGRRQCIEAKELRSDDGRRWLRFTDDRGQSKHLPFSFPVCLIVVLNSDCVIWPPGLFTPWADVEGRPLWTPQGERPTAKVRRALATTPLMTSVNRTAEHDDDRTRCYLRDCQHCAQFKCERCERFICLKHHVKYRSGYRSYDYCPPCADRTRRLVLIALALAVVVLAAGGLVICLITR